jgi:uncharacterized protein
MKKTVVLGASTDPSRYAYVAVKMLQRYNHEVIPVGREKGEINGAPILNGEPEIDQVDTVTLYIGKARLPQFTDYIYSLHPKRIIFNPGTENEDVIKEAENKGIECVRGCTLVMLSIGSY